MIFDKGYDKSSFLIDSIRMPPFFVRALPMSGYNQAVDCAYSLHPAFFSRTFHTDVELKKIIVKPPVYNIVNFFKAIPLDVTGADSEYATACVLKDTGYKIPDSAEAYVYLRVRLNNKDLLGQEGLFYVTNKRKLLVSFEDFEGKGLLIPAGSEMNIEILVIDVSFIRSFRTVGFQLLFANGNARSKENTMLSIESTRLSCDSCNGSAQEAPEKIEVPLGYIAATGPGLLYFLPALKSIDSDAGIPRIVEPGTSTPPPKPIPGDWYPVDIIFLGFYAKKTKCVFGAGS